MAISLQKGQKIDLHKKDGSQLTNLMVGLGWKEVQQKGGLLGLFKQKEDVDIDASVIMLIEWKNSIQRRDYLLQS